MTSLIWYVLHCHSRFEEAVTKYVTSLGIESYFPFIIVNPVNPRARKIQSFFPGYIFVHTDLGLVGESVFNNIPFSIGLVNFGGEPAVLDENIVNTTRRHLEEINIGRNEVRHDLKPGQKLTIESGMFSGYEASFLTYLSGNQRVRVLMRLLAQDRCISLDLPVGQVVPLKNNI